MDLRLKCPETIKLLEENIAYIHFYINCSNLYIRPISYINQNKNNNKKLYLIKIKGFCTAKETINKMN